MKRRTPLLSPGDKTAHGRIKRRKIDKGGTGLGDKSGIEWTDATWNPVEWPRQFPEAYATEMGRFVPTVTAEPA